jgi:hypothetical protein
VVTKVYQHTFFESVKFSAFFFVSWDGVKPSPRILRLLLVYFYQPRTMTDDDDDCGGIGGMLGRGNRSTQRKPCLSGAMSTTNPT